MELRTMQSREPSREDTGRVVRSFTAGASVRRASRVVRRRSSSSCVVRVRRRVTLASNRARLFVSLFVLQKLLGTSSSLE